jgi:hypothetical protein
LDELFGITRPSLAEDLIPKASVPTVHAVQPLRAIQIVELTDSPISIGSRSIQKH